MRPLTIVVVVATCASASCARPPGNGPGPEQFCDSSSTQTQALRAAIVTLGIRVDGKQCIPQTSCGDPDSCSLDLGNIQVGVDRRVDFEIDALGTNRIDLLTISIGGNGPGWYLEGQPPTEAGPTGNANVPVVLRATEPGPCDATLLVESNAANVPRGVAFEYPIRATCIDGATPGCVATNACCCANGATLDPPTCDSDEQLQCANGFIALDDACNDAPCVP